MPRCCLGGSGNPPSFSAHLSRSIVDISIEPDVCNFLGDSSHGNWWSLFVPSFPYRILLAGKGVGCIGSARWH